jgi:hypothetical protein
LAHRILEDWLELQAWPLDSEEAWGAATVALAPEILPVEDWNEKDSANESR